MTNGSGEYHPKVRDVMSESKPEQLSGLKLRLERESRYFSDKPMPDRLLLAWHSHLAGYLEAGGISISDYDQLAAMLPRLPDASPTPIEEIALGRIFDDEDLGDCE